MVGNLNCGKGPTTILVIIYPIGSLHSEIMRPFIGKSLSALPINIVLAAHPKVSNSLLTSSLKKLKLLLKYLAFHAV